jgi:hypothetical protein
MSEERFVVGSNEIGEIIVTDVETGNVYRYDNIYNFFGLIRLLNEQQATISKQLDKIIELQDKYRILEFNHSRLEKRNKAQYEKIDEQQTIINKLKEENKELKQQLEQIPPKIKEVWLK